jgi:DNA-binding transcriptional regulator GbsR (MarR family)
MAKQFPPRKFFWDIFSTLYEEDASDLIQATKEMHYSAMAEKREKKPLIMREDVFQKLKDLHYFSKSKGKALHFMDLDKRKKEAERSKRKAGRKF